MTGIFARRAAEAVFVKPGDKQPKEPTRMIAGALKFLGIDADPAEILAGFRRMADDVGRAADAMQGMRAQLDQANAKLDQVAALLPRLAQLEGIIADTVPEARHLVGELNAVMGALPGPLDAPKPNGAADHA